MPLFQAEIARKPTYSGMTLPRSLLDQAGRHAHRQDRIGPGDARRAVRLLPDDAPGRVPHDRRGSPQIGLSSRSGSAPTPRARASGWRRSGPGMGVPGGWLTIGPPKRSARPTNRTARRDTFRSMSPDTWLPSREEGKPTSRFAALWVRENRTRRRRPHGPGVIRRRTHEGPGTTEERRTGPLTLHAWRQADDQMGYSGVWHKTATGTPGTASFQSGLSEADLPGVVAQQAGSLIDLDLSAAPPPPSTKERAATALQAAEAALKAKPDDLKARFARATAHFQLGENQKAIDDLNVVIEKAPQIRHRLSVPCHRPRPAGSQGPGEGGSGAVPEGKRHREPEALPRCHRGGGTG